MFVNVYWGNVWIFCKRARAFWLIVAIHHFMREQKIFGWNWGGEHKEAYLNFGAIICPITEVLHFPSTPSKGGLCPSKRGQKPPFEGKKGFPPNVQYWNVPAKFSFGTISVGKIRGKYQPRGLVHQKGGRSLPLREKRGSRRMYDTEMSRPSFPLVRYRLVNTGKIPTDTKPKCQIEMQL